MTDSDESDTERKRFKLFDVFDSRQLVAQCPHCDHSEALGDKATARAWMTAHIIDDHSDELPETEVQRCER